MGQEPAGPVTKGRRKKHRAGLGEEEKKGSKWRGGGETEILGDPRLARRPISMKWRLPQGQGQGTGGEGQGVAHTARDSARASHHLCRVWATDWKAEGCTKTTREERQMEIWTQCGWRCGLSIAEARNKTQQKKARLE